MDDREDLLPEQVQVIRVLQYRKDCGNFFYYLVRVLTMVSEVDSIFENVQIDISDFWLSAPF